jgi:photosystem II stability/assembly factor-like uncharacterized protein
MIGPEGGSVKSLAMNPVNHDELYAITISGLVYRTTDAARTWRLTAALKRSLGDVEFDPKNSNIIYLLENDGILKSTDHGLNWTEYLFGAGYSGTSSLTVSPTDPNIIHVAGRYSGTSSRRGTVLRSTDGGKTWLPRTITSGYSAACDGLAVDPIDPNIIYAYGYYYWLFGGPFYYNFLKSVDGGATWSYLNLWSSLHSIAVDPNNPSRIYVDSGGIYRSTNAGLTWTKSSSEASGVLAIDPSNSNTIYAGSQVVYKSTDAGINWTKSSQGLSGTCRSLLVSSNGVYFASDAGIYKSENGGVSWQESHAQLIASTIPVLAVAPSSLNTIYAGITGGGMFKSTDFGRHWTKLPSSFELTATGLWVNPQNANDLLLLNRQLWRSSDTGLTWTAVPKVIDKWYYLQEAVISPSNPAHIFVCGFDYKDTTPFMVLEVSTDGGQNWQLFEVSNKGYGYALAVDMSNENTIYVGGSMDGKPALFKTSNGGTGWTRIDGGALGDMRVEEIELDPISNSVIYVGTDSGLYRTENLGNTWANTLPYPVTAIKVNSLNPYEVFAAGSTGIYVSGNKGKTWRDFNPGLPVTEISGLAMAAHDRALYAGTWDGGILSLRLPTRGRR